jgi:hypothetical protein
MRIGDTAAVSAELQAMVGTLDSITQVLSLMQGSKAMGTPVEQRNGRAVGLAEQHNRLLEKATVQQLSGFQLR